MKLTFLGTGTSTGVPTLGCSCSVCLSTDPRNKRMRSSLWVQQEGTSLVIDTGPEFRLQALGCGLSRLDAVLLTHAHADHVHGLDDVRPLSLKKAVMVAGSPETLEAVHRLFPYIFTPPTTGTTVPNLELRTLTPGQTYSLGNLAVLPLTVYHGQMPILGYRLGKVAYLTDCSFIPEETYSQLSGLEVLILDSLRPRPHPTHFSESQAVEAAQRIGAGRTYFTHMNHDCDHGDMSRRLPQGMFPAYDGLEITVEE